MPKANVVRQLVQRSKNSFDKVLDKVKILSANDGVCTASLVIEKEHTNLMEGLHGGLSATLVDCISSWALFTHKNGERASVSVNINMTYLAGAKIGDEILIDAKTLRAGKSMAFLEVEIRNKLNNTLLVKGEHTKFLL